MTSDSLGCNDLFLRVDLCCFDENNHFLTEIEAGSTEKFLVIRFSVYENDAPDVISHENQLQHLSEPSIFILDVFRTADHAGQIFIPHRPSKFHRAGIAEIRSRMEHIAKEQVGTCSTNTQRHLRVRMPGWRAVRDFNLCRD